MKLNVGRFGIDKRKYFFMQRIATIIQWLKKGLDKLLENMATGCVPRPLLRGVYLWVLVTENAVVLMSC